MSRLNRWRNPMDRFVKCLMAAALLLTMVVCPMPATAAKYKVLVVMSYEDDYQFEEDIKEGIDSVLADVSDLKYFYMNTKVNLDGGPAKAEEAYQLYQSFQPDGVIAADDNAQAMFVVKYLKDKVKVPVMFCGVNADPEKYGYPTDHISGVLERLPIGPSIALIKMLVPSIETVGMLEKKGPSAEAVFSQATKEMATYPARVVSQQEVTTLEGLVETVKELDSTCDSLFLSAMQGLTGPDGKTVSEKEAFQAIARTFKKPTATVVEYRIKYGILGGVAATGQEQGSTAARMLIEALEGKPVSEIPVTQNKGGLKIINVDVMKSLGIKPRANVLRGVKLVRTVE